MYMTNWAIISARNECKYIVDHLEIHCTYSACLYILGNLWPVLLDSSTVVPTCPWSSHFRMGTSSRTGHVYRLDYVY